MQAAASTGIPHTTRQCCVFTTKFPMTAHSLTQMQVGVGVGRMLITSHGGLLSSCNCMMIQFKWLGKWHVDMFMSLFAFTRLSRTQFGPGQWKSWRRDFQSSAVHGKGCMHISVWTHLKCLTYCVNYVFVSIYILDLESCQIINKYHISVSISISIYNYIYICIC